MRLKSKDDKSRNGLKAYFTYCRTFVWNSLDSNIKLSFSICSFRNRMKKALLLNLV